MKRVSIRSVAISCFLIAAPSLGVADNLPFSSDNGNFVVVGDIGFANIKAQEFVYQGDHKLSQLNWESKGMTLVTVGVDAQIDNDWSLKGSVKVGAIGNGHMTDYDWVNREHDYWSHRPVHPGTELDHYLVGAIEIDRIVYGNETSSFAVGAGVRYTDVKWTAYGGSGIHTIKKFRDTPVAWSSAEKVISYRQKVPVGFLSLSSEHVLGDLTISGDVAPVDVDVLDAEAQAPQPFFRLAQYMQGSQRSLRIEDKYLSQAGCECPSSTLSTEQTLEAGKQLQSFFFNALPRSHFDGRLTARFC
ncbi:Protease 7 [Ensifer psoraleae]|uniref:omptin family outer membrane protease n=1 Tax=Sinorhizobium psoraleae TaxID=520838 RepID=UPI0015693C68|nr:omptin family outer membrane protease [Sinorhizobium psoraleae]NRP75827.1 Protease 7 [Sinorhizobium psoraleae]